VAEGFQFTEGPAVNDRGELFFTDIPNSRIHKVGLDGKVSVFAEETGNANGLMFGADGRLYACANGKKQIVTYAPDGKVSVLAENVTSNDLVVGTTGVHFTDPANKKVFHLDKENRLKEVDSGIERPNGVILSPDQTLLYVADSVGQFVYSFQVQPDGSLKHKQPYFHLRLAHGATSSGADGMTVDADGRLYVATRIGVQVLDPPGRVHVTLSKPQRAGLSNVVFGGPDLDVLYVTSVDKVYRRRLAAKGALPLRGPVKPPRPRL
jgi:sugar lactone lactonase YvrE